VNYDPAPPEAEDQQTEEPPTRSTDTPTEGRTNLTQPEKIKVWVRAGGICVLCQRYLLEGELTGVLRTFGELAHIVGQQNSARSPRGLHPMPRADRDTADNVLLACASCHNEIDDQLAVRILDIDTLVQLKRDHEQRIRHVTTLPAERRSLVLRVIGQVRGEAVEVSRSTAAGTVVAGGRIPWFDLDRNRIGVEIDLRHLPGETDPGPNYFTTACAAIDEVMDNLVRTGVRTGELEHLSVFALARVPLLIYLGTKLEDNYTVEVYQRHRASQAWTWDDTAPVYTFTATTGPGIDEAREAVLQLNVSGTVNVCEMPAELQRLPRITVEPDATPTTDVLCNRASLDSFRSAIRAVNADLDAHEHLDRLHVIGALPPAAAVELGRLHDPHIHPSLVTYNRADSGYHVALEIS
jgi:hypothetical protein